jgi:hypothetical protein
MMVKTTAALGARADDAFAADGEAIRRGEVEVLRPLAARRSLAPCRTSVFSKIRPGSRATVAAKRPLEEEDRWSSE